MSDEYSQNSIMKKMLSGELYLAEDPELGRAYSRAQSLLATFNATPADQHDALCDVLKKLLGHIGSGAIIKPTLRCDYGFNISLGDRTFVNYDCVFLDCNKIIIGDEVQIAPGVHIYTATHPLDADARRKGLERALPVTIGSGVWLGGRAIICPGVTIGENSVIGAGSVVTRDLPANVLAAGNPCRIIRDL